MASPIHSNAAQRASRATMQRSRLRATTALAAVVLATAPIAAQEVPAAGLARIELAQAGGAQAFSIPPQPLASALDRLAQQTGLSFAYRTGELEGVASPGVTGTLTPRQALDRLLAGTGVAFTFTDADTVTLARPGAQEGDGPMQLGPITVEGWRATEVRGYRPEVISSATKTEEPIVDVPVSVSVVTEDVIEDQDARSVEEALRNVPGVGFGPNASNVSVQEEVTIRGFETPLVNVNGIERRSTGPLSLANVESVEVLKGPFSVLYGDLSPGGFVNVQTKRPQPVFSAEAVAGFSQVAFDGGARGTQGNGSIDVTGPINDDATLLYRFIASAEGGSSFIDDVTEEQYLFAPSLSFIGLDRDLRVDLDFSYLRNDETFIYGVPSRNGEPDTRPPYDTFFGAEDNEKLTEDWTAEVRAAYAIAESTTLDAAFSWHLNEHFSLAVRPIGIGDQVAADDTITRGVLRQDFDTTDIQFEANAIQDFSFGPTDWQFLVGGDVRRTKFEDAIGRGISDPRVFDTTNVFDPDTDVDLPSNDELRFFDPVEQTSKTFGVYAQADVWIFDRLKLLAGARYTEVDYEFEQAGFSFEENPDSIDPRFGALFKVTPATSAYASYSSSFEQSFSFDVNATEPLEAEQVELGVKQEFFGGRALATLSVFELTQRNRVEFIDLDVDPFFAAIQIGEARTRGLEIELSGEIVDGLRVIGGYAFLDNEITEAEDNVGNRLPLVAEHSASMWLTYDVLDRDDERFTVGGGAFFQGERFTDSANEFELPSFVTVDVMAEYAFAIGDRQLRARAGVKNLFDEEHFVSGFGQGVGLRGEPRTITAELGIKF
jgi:iron complex outermembrane receptor protein